MIPSRSSMPGRRRGGFTLVEMLVAVALTVLMMFLFARIFQIATGAMSIQRGLAENDQRARMLTTIVRSDLQARTFISVVPWLRNEDYDPTDPDERYLRPELREGYFYISENDPDDDTDDVLQFTVRLLKEELPYYGAATRAFADPALPPDRNSNQPAMDDGDWNNQSGESHAAEVVYFLRNGNLYRRMLLLRPLPTLSQPEVQPTQLNAPFREFFDPTNDGTNGMPPRYNGVFWREFDYSAYFSPFPSVNQLQFNGLDALNNKKGGPVAALGKPFTRFGFYEAPGASTPWGAPREYINPSSPSPDTFFGRFTQQETAHSTFGYPFIVPNPNPMTRTDPKFKLVNGAVQPYHDEKYRRAEDIVMTNVLAFDIKVWDPGLAGAPGSVSPGFYDVGHSAGAGYFSQTVPAPPFNRAGNKNPAYGPRTAGNRVFDTWHPVFNAPPTPFRLRRPDPADPTNPGADRPTPLQAIQIMVMYRDVSSGQVRQLTLVESFVPKKAPAAN